MLILFFGGVDFNHNIYGGWVCSISGVQVVVAVDKFYGLGGMFLKFCNLETDRMLGPSSGGVRFRLRRGGFVRK